MDRAWNDDLDNEKAVEDARARLRQYIVDLGFPEYVIAADEIVNDILEILQLW